MLLGTLVKELDLKGTLHVLRHGFKFYGKTIRVAYFKPAHGANAEALALYGKNRLQVIRQVACHPGDNRTIDMVLVVNGLPVATIELKNPGTGQNWRHAVRQYREAGARALRRRPRRDPHDDASNRGADALPAVQSRKSARRHSVRRGEPAAPLGPPYWVLLGGRPGVRQSAGHPWTLHVRRKAGREG
jgi:hypothetical protein